MARYYIPDTHHWNTFMDLLSNADISATSSPSCSGVVGIYHIQMHETANDVIATAVTAEYMRNKPCLKVDQAFIDELTLLSGNREAFVHYVLTAGGSMNIDTL